MAIDWAVFYKNRAAFPLDELAKYAGRWVAWAPDGASIVASSAESEPDLYAQVQAAGHDLAECCVSYVPAGDDVILGGMSMIEFPGPERGPTSGESAHGASRTGEIR
jgi:hypothetical protein